MRLPVCWCWLWPPKLNSSDTVDMVDTYGNYGVYPFAGVRATTAYTGIPATAAVPAAYPVAYGYPSFSATQYHAQDELGQASFGYAHPGQAASNLRDGFGNQIGSYAYVNPKGKEVRVSYTADSRGFRVKSNNLPVAPVDNSVAPLPVQDTPEVAAAKAEFAVKFAAAKASRAKRQVFGFGAAPFSYPGYAVSPYAYSVAAPAVYATPAMPIIETTLTKVIHTPGHAVSYRVD
ncbi:cuticle protein 7-like [Daphnia pulex]|uniref:cuticle protein 7-like n=1 Tax=Daphnia pulex TaxID=6669 RepID=UPI001EE038AB|nr:cuticle protein 7-like [Daphnia pulex]